MRPAVTITCSASATDSPCDWGPRRITVEGEVRATFGDGWTVDSIEPTDLDITIDPWQGTSPGRRRVTRHVVRGLVCASACISGGRIAPQLGAPLAHNGTPHPVAVPSQQP